MITSFADVATADLFNGADTKAARKIPKAIWTVARRKLDMLNAAATLLDLKSPPNKKLEALARDLKGKHAIRVNDQYRVIFTWKNGSAEDVSVSDYH